MQGERIYPESAETQAESQEDAEDGIPKPQMTMNGQPMMTRMNTAGYTKAGG